MRRALVSMVVVAGILSSTEVQTSQRHSPTATRPAHVGPCGTPLGFQVRLDRAGFSPGELDGASGGNTRHALAAFQHAHRLSGNGAPNCETWRALSNRESNEVTTRVRISSQDVDGPFTQHIPDDLPSQADLPRLGYTGLLERLAEKFHTAPVLLRRLNPHARFVADEEITVPDVEPFDADARPSRSSNAGEVRVDVSARTSMLRVVRPDGSVLFAAPVSSGSEHDPLPTGHWKITSVTWYPVFHYNPDLFWDADASRSKATIQPGPNGPVGVAWLGLDVEHYGIHGTPEPSLVGHAQSHGCVRLTNWDIARVAALVKAGTPVVFE